MNVARDTRVAICQSSIIAGGRLRVILDIVNVLNDLGITPDILTMHLKIPQEEFKQKYGKAFQANIKLLPYIPRLPQEFEIAVFNVLLRHYARDYGLLINTNNSLFFLPRQKSVVSYVFFPRKRRIMADLADLHMPNSHISPWSRIGRHRAVLRPLYRLNSPRPEHTVVCMTEFTRAALLQAYPTLTDLPVIYPAVDITEFECENQDRDLSVITIGRFTPNKRQLEQIRLAARLPHIPFHIVGFVGNQRYYQQCVDYVENHHLNNVMLHPDMAFQDMISLLQQSRYFLHTLINEPFGLTAVQAIAAGCIPIVHDSGGQREVVIEPRLRYSEMEDIPEILAYLEGQSTAWTSKLTTRLQAHIRASFHQAVFYQRMKPILLSHIDAA
jgi:glycosyltransferase involved in cell wall biosynthesis